MKLLILPHILIQLLERQHKTNEMLISVLQVM